MKMYRNRYYQGSLSDERAAALCQVLELKSNPSLIKSIKSATSTEIEEIIQAYKNGTEPPVITRLGELTDGQTVSVTFMYYSQRCLIGDDTGLGKTVQCAAFINLLSVKKQRKVLFLTEKTNVPQIQHKLIKFTGEYADILPSAEKGVLQKWFKANPNGLTRPLVGSHSLLCNSEFLTYLGDYGLDCLIIDEGKIVKNTTNQYYKAAQVLSKDVPYFFILNATPLEIEARDMYNQLKLLDKSFVPTVADFNRAYCRMQPKTFGRGWEVVGYKNCEEFLKFISLRYTARSRTDAGAVVENNNVKIINTPLSNTQKELLKRTSAYQMVIDYPTGVDREIDYNVTTTGKLDALVELCKQTEGKILVYSFFVDCQSGIKQELEKYGRKPVVLNGQVTGAKRDEVIKDFNVGNYDVLITNIARGIDLFGCDTCIFYTIDPNPQNMVQTFGRLTRDINVIGKNMYFLVSEGREQKTFETTLKLRATASMKFTRNGTNIVLSTIANQE